MLDLSAEALAITGARLSARARSANLVVADVRDWTPDRTYDLWHDRAAFQFLTDMEDRRRYLRTLDAALRPGGVVIISGICVNRPCRLFRFAGAALCTVGPCGHL